jgi:glycerophosphoryl diester phosphodiesterase
MQIILFCIVLLLSCQQAGAQLPAQLPPGKHSFIVIAHRGNHTFVPENTMAAFKEAIKNGVDYVEIDLRTTKDSVLVIMHDATVDRMTNGKGKINELTYAALRQLKITGNTKDSNKVYTVPAFEEVLSACKNRIYIYLDFKDASVEQVYKMIRKYEMENQLIVYINTPIQYTEWKRVAPGVPLMLSLPGNIKTGEEVRNYLEKLPVSLLDGDYSNYTAGMVAAAESAGVQVWPDIQSAGEAINWDKALKTGFKGLQTDHPEALIAYLKKKGLR